MKESLRCEWVKCGKSGCQSCPHGPYWYAYRWESGKTRKRYIGKDLPKSDREPESPTGDQHPRHPWDRILSDRTATFDLAREILGVTRAASFEEIRTAFRTLSKVNHPDRGGTHDVYVRILAAFNFLKTLYTH